MGVDWRRPQYLLPIVVAIALALPCFRFGYLFDDFDFIERAQRFRPADLLPDVHSLFYRPLSREVFFGILHLFRLDTPAMLHVFNSLLEATAVALLMILASRLLGTRGGVIAGLLFASLGSLPVLIGWASGVQDLLAIVFVLLSILLQLEGRTLLAVLAIGGAILSKETAASLVPALAIQEWILHERRPSLKITLPYAVLLIAWVTIHPGLHLLFARHFQSGGTGYLGLDNPDRVSSVVRSVLTLANLPVAAVSLQWIGTRLLALLLASAAAVFAVLQFRSSDSPSRDLELHYSKGRVLMFAALLTVLPVLLTASLMKYWAPYYVCLSGIGGCLIGATLLENQPSGRLLPLVLAFMTLGVIARGAEVDPSISTERNLERTTGALHQVEAGFKKLYPSLSRGSTVYVFSQSHGIEGVYIHMYHFQALRVWYQDPSLLITKPQRRRPGERKEYLFWIAPNLDVVEIDPTTLRARSSGTRPAYYQYQKTLRAYAFGLAVTGHAMRAAQILTRMPEPDITVWGLDARIAAMLLLADGKIEFAKDLLAHVPPMGREDALSALTGVLAESPPSLDLDEAGLEAFGVKPSDADAARYLMKWFVALGYDSPAMRFAQRLLRLLPHDPEGSAVLRELSQKQERDRLTPNAAADSL
jgi:hypothetical protein